MQSIRDKNQDREIQRRITARWAAFAKQHDIFKGNTGTCLSLQACSSCLKRQVYNSCIIPATSNDIWHGNMGTHQPSIEQASSRINKDWKEYVKHHIAGLKNKHLGKRKNKGHRSDVIEQVRKPHVSRIRINCWTLHITSWKPYKRKRPIGRQARLWRDKLDN